MKNRFILLLVATLLLTTTVRSYAIYWPQVIPQIVANGNLLLKALLKLHGQWYFELDTVPYTTSFTFDRGTIGKYTWPSDEGTYSFIISHIGYETHMEYYAHMRDIDGSYEVDTVTGERYVFDFIGEDVVSGCAYVDPDRNECKTFHGGRI